MARSKALVLAVLLAAAADLALGQSILYLDKCMDASFMGAELAIQYCDRALASKDLSDGNRIAALYQRGQLLSAGNHLEKALADFDEALRLRPDYVGDKERALLHLVRGEARLRRQLDGQAFEDFNEALRLNPELGDAYASRGLGWLRRGNPAKAIEDFDEAMRRQPASSFGTRYVRVPLSSRQAMDRSELDAIAHYGRGVAYSRQGNPARAVENFSEALRLRPDQSPPLIGRASAYIALNDFGRALADLDALVRIKPQDPGAFYMRGVTHAKNKTFERATADLDEALRLNPRFREAYLWRGMAWADRNDFDRALADVNRAIALAPDDREALALRSSLLQRREAARK